MAISGTKGKNVLFREICNLCQFCFIYEDFDYYQIFCHLFHVILQQMSN